MEQLRAALRAAQVEWPALEADGVADADLRDTVDAITDILGNETFYKELPALNSATARIQTAYKARYDEAAAERTSAYQAALAKLAGTPGWKDLKEDTQSEIAEPLRRRAEQGGSTASLAMLRENTLACPGILQNAVQRVLQSVGTKPDIVVVSGLIRGTITNEEQLDAALGQIREQCLKHLADGTPVILA